MKTRIPVPIFTNRSQKKISGVLYEMRRAFRIISFCLLMLFCIAPVFAQSMLDGSFESCGSNHISADANTIQSFILGGCTTNFAMFGNGLDQSFFSDGTQGTSYGTGGCFFYAPAPTNGSSNIGISAGGNIALKLSSNLVPGSCYTISFDVTNSAGDDGSGSCATTTPAKFSFGASSLSSAFGTTVATMANNINPSNTATLGQTVSFVAPAGANNYITIQMADQSNTFSILFIDNVSISPVLCAVPLTLVDFYADFYSGKNIQLKWQTAAEINVSRFEIELSKDATRFIKAGTVAAQGLNSGSEYSFNVSNVNSISYYRLKVIDLDGSFKYSKILLVKNNGQNASGQFSVNPNIIDAAGMLHLRSEVKGEYQLSIKNTLGQIEYTKMLQLNTGNNDVHTDHLSKGLHIVELVNKKNEKTASLKLVIQ
jgi:hypothetical protein